MAAIASRDVDGLRVEALAAQAGISVDTVRYYQARGLLDPPRRRGRVALYDDGHRRRLDEIRALADRGFTLAQIAELEHPGDPLLDRLAGRHPVDPALDLDELARRTGLDPEVVTLAVDAGLVQGMVIEGTRRFAPTAVEMLAAVSRLRDAGLSLDGLARIAVRHAEHVEGLIDDAIDLYRSAGPDDHHAVSADLDELLPLVSAMITAHFEQTLVERALSRLDDDS